MTRGDRKHKLCEKECWIHPDSGIRYNYCRECLRKDGIKKFLQKEDFEIPTDEQLKANRSRKKATTSSSSTPTKVANNNLRPDKPAPKEGITALSIGSSSEFVFLKNEPHVVLWRMTTADNQTQNVPLGMMDPKTGDFIPELDEDAQNFCDERKYRGIEHYQDDFEEKRELFEEKLAQFKESLNTKHGSEAPTVRQNQFGGPSAFGKLGIRRPPLNT